MTAERKNIYERNAEWFVTYDLTHPFRAETTTGRVKPHNVARVDPNLDFVTAVLKPYVRTWAFTSVEALNAFCDVYSADKA